MLAQIQTINGQKQIIPLTADAGSGAPLGTIHGFYKKMSYPGYLYLDGSTFDETQYPALYAYLGTNVLPDYREFVLVGAEQNTTSATIATHDVFTQGQEKDDQLQEHIHQLTRTSITASTGGGIAFFSENTSGLDTGNVSTGRSGTTTRTKEKAVFWYIKATTGVNESEATEVLNLFKAELDWKYLGYLNNLSGHTDITLDAKYKEFMLEVMDNSGNIRSSVYSATRENIGTGVQYLCVGGNTDTLVTYVASTRLLTYYRTVSSNIQVYAR